MIKKVDVKLLQTGMFIHSFDSGWMGHPFLRNSMPVKSRHTINKIRTSGIRFLYIDTDKGVDVESAVPEDDVKREIEEQIGKIESPEDQPEDIPLAEEIVVAGDIRREAKKIIKDCMLDVRLGRQIEVESVNMVVRKMVFSIFNNRDALTTLSRLRSKDEYTFEHSVNVCIFMVSFARSLSMERNIVLDIGVGALLHDIGKMKIPDNLLNKPGRLTEKEFELMKMHVRYSEELLSSASDIPLIAVEVASQHHERFSGSGYPRALKGEGISLFGQMAAIVDVYDAITADRCYHRGMRPHDALGKIYEWSKFHFNRGLVEAFIKSVGIYPVGTLVKLKNGLLGIVREQNPENILCPAIEVFYDPSRMAYITPRAIDMRMPEDGEEIDSSVSPDEWGFDMRRLLENPIVRMYEKRL